MTPEVGQAVLACPASGSLATFPGHPILTLWKLRVSYRSFVSPIPQFQTTLDRAATRHPG